MSEPASANPSVRRVILLGSTGSIGVQTLEVIDNLNRQAQRGGSLPRFEVVGLAAGRNADTLLEQAARWNVRDAAIADGADPEAPAGMNLRRGPDAAERLICEVQADLVVGAMVGSAGLPATLAALRRGVDVALANKETLVAAGSLVVPEAEKSGARLLPVDSEHSAIWQCVADRCTPPCSMGDEVRRVVLTASGGPFRTAGARETYEASPEQALAHPTWSMGAKVTIDSASLTNKALEVIEAHWLFGLPADRIDVLVHPQSIVHSFVEFADGSALAQLGAPDMRTPIQYALTHPHRPAGVSEPMDWPSLARLDFEPPDHDRFPALRLAYEVIERGGVAGAVFNAANEAAVEAFLARRISFGRITELAAEALRSIVGEPRTGPAAAMADLDGCLAADAEARSFVESRLSQTAAGRVRREPAHR